MDEVWLLSVCLTVLAIVIGLLSLRKSDDKSESSAKAKERSPQPVYSSPQMAARNMELSVEDLDKSLERLGVVLGTEPPAAKGAASWGHVPAPGSESDTLASLSGSEEPPQCRHGESAATPQGWAEHSGNDTWSHPERQGRDILEHPPATSATQNIMEQIEQAVQETPDHNRECSEVIRIRRAPPAPRLETPPRDDVLQSRSLHSSD